MIKYDNNKPMYLQVINDLKKRIVNKEFLSDSKFPSTRELAIEYCINPNTASRVYREMELTGICYTKKGLGTYLSKNNNIVNNLKETMANKLLNDFLESMYSLGYEKNEIITKINLKGRDEQ